MSAKVFYAFRVTYVLEIFMFIKLYASWIVYICGIIFLEAFMLFDIENDYAVSNTNMVVTFTTL